MQLTCFIPNYNGARFLKKTLKSIENQSLSDFKVIVADDGSTDTSLKIAKDFLSRLPMQIIPYPNGGIAKSWNRVFENVKTKYFTITHCDDQLEPDYFREMVSLMDAFPKAAIGHCPAKTIDETGNIFYSHQENYKKKHFFKSFNSTRPRIEEYRLLLKGNYICCPSVIYRTESVKQVGYFNNELHLALDWEYWFRILLSGFEIAAIKKDLFRYRRHGTNASVIAGKNLIRFKEEHSLLLWAHREGQKKSWIEHNEKVSFTALAYTIIPEIALDLTAGNNTNARSKIELLKLNLPQFKRFPLSLALNCLLFLGKFGGRLLDLSIRSAIAFLNIKMKE